MTPTTQQMDELMRQNVTLKAELDAIKNLPKPTAARITHVGDGCFYGATDGEWVSYVDYEELHEYTERLISFSKLPCLPADLDNLRKANTEFAVENQQLKETVRDLETKILQESERDQKSKKSILKIEIYQVLTNIINNIYSAENGAGDISVDDMALINSLLTHNRAGIRSALEDDYFVALFDASIDEYDEVRITTNGVLFMVITAGEMV